MHVNFELAHCFKLANDLVSFKLNIEFNYAFIKKWMVHFIDINLITNKGYNKTYLGFRDVIDNAWFQTSRLDRI